MTFDIIALVCRLGMDPSECQPPTAFDKIYLGHVSNELMCGMFGQERLAQVASMVPDGYWAKLTCPRTEDDAL